jgi:hypothetical protein
VSRRVVDSAGVGTAFTCPHALDNPARRVIHTAHNPYDDGLSQPFYDSSYSECDAVFVDQ